MSVVERPTQGTNLWHNPSWVKVGGVVISAEIVIHTAAGQLLNEWEGWGVFAQNAAYAVVTGLVLGALAFGVLVRWGLKESPRGRNRPAIASAVGGVISVLSYYMFFTWMPVLFGAATVILALSGLTRSREDHRGRRAALTGLLLGGAVLAFWVFMLAWAFTVGAGDYPVDFG
jgi:hypothetical protein